MRFNSSTPSVEEEEEEEVPKSMQQKLGLGFDF